MIYKGKSRFGYICSYYAFGFLVFFVGYSLDLCLRAYFAPGGRCSF